MCVLRVRVLFFVNVGWMEKIPDIKKTKKKQKIYISRIAPCFFNGLFVIYGWYSGPGPTIDSWAGVGFFVRNR